MKKELIIGVLALGLVSGVVAQVSETTGQNSNVSVSVSDITAIDVRPSSLNYNNVAPGADRASSANNYEHIEIENIGSSRVGEVYAQATMPTEQPFGTDASAGDPAQHDTGNFVTMSLETAQDGSNSYSISGLQDITTPHFVNRVEYFETEYPTYIDVDSSSGGTFNSSTMDSPVNSVDVGRMRVGGAEYFYAVYGTDAGTALRVGDTPHTSTQLGTTDLSSDGNDFTSYDTTGGGLSSASNGSVFEASSHKLVSFDTTTDEFGGESLINDGTTTGNTSGLSDVEVRSYDLLVDTSNDFILRSKFNVAPEIPGGFNSSESSSDTNWIQSADASSARSYILDASTDSDALQPGENFPINFGIQVPQGVDQNAIQEGTVSLIASDTIA